MILAKLISSDAYTPVNKTIAKTFGFVSAWYFGELIRQRERFGQDEFYFSQSQMTEEIGISEHDQRTALKKFVEVGFVFTIKKGMPSKYYFRIADDTVLDFFKLQCSKIWSTCPPKIEAQVTENIEHKDKKEIKKEIRNINKEIFDFWNTKKVVEHGKITSTIELAMKKALKDYSQEEIETAITVYAEVLKSKKTQFSYKWTLDEFLSRKNALPVFLYKKLEDYIFDGTPRVDKVGEIKKTQEIVQKHVQEEKTENRAKEEQKREDDRVLRWYESSPEYRKNKIDAEIEKNPLITWLSPIVLPDEALGIKWDSQNDIDRKKAMIKTARTMATLLVARKFYYHDHEAMQQ